MRPFSQRAPGELFLPSTLAHGWYGPTGNCGCCGEEPTCEVFTDNFDRADGDPGSNWDGADWSISSGSLCCSTDGAECECQVTHPDTFVYVSAAYSGASNDIFYLYTDAGNVKAEVKIGSSGYIKLYVNGSLVQTRDKNVSTTGTVNLCCSEEMTSASVAFGATTVSVSDPHIATSAVSGVGFVSGGSVCFASFQIAKRDAESECGGCEVYHICPGCNGGTTLPTRIFLELTGFQDSQEQPVTFGCTAGRCDSYHGSDANGIYPLHAITTTLSQCIYRTEILDIQFCIGGTSGDGIISRLHFIQIDWGSVKTVSFVRENTSSNPLFTHSGTIDCNSDFDLPLTPTEGYDTGGCFWYGLNRITAQGRIFV